MLRTQYILIVMSLLIMVHDSQGLKTVKKIALALNSTGELGACISWHLLKAKKVEHMYFLVVDVDKHHENTVVVICNQLIRTSKTAILLFCDNIDIGIDEDYEDSIF